MQTIAILRRSSIHLLLGTLISRSSGLIRDLYTAFCFGADPAIAAFFIAYRLASFFRRLVAESSLSAGFIPHFEALHIKSEKEAVSFFFDVTATILFGSLLLTLLSLGGWFYFISEQMISLGDGSVLSMTLTMLPSLGAISLYALFMSFLQCYRHYFLSALAPISFNLFFIGTLYATRFMPRVEAAQGLCFAVLAGYVVQWALLIPSVYRKVGGFLTWDALGAVRCISPAVRALLGSWSLTLVGICAVQVNGLIDMGIARYASLEGPAYLTYAIRIAQAPLALFGLTIASALMPPLSRAIVAGKKEESSQFLLVSLIASLTLLVPCSFWFIANAYELVELLYGYHTFHAEAIQETSLCLAAYALGLVPSALVIVLAGAFYAQKEFWLPTRISLFSILFNIFINVFLVCVIGLGAVSVALATSLAAYGNCLFLLYALAHNASFNLSLNQLKAVLIPVFAASLIACWVLFRLQPFASGAFVGLAQLLPVPLYRLFPLGVSFGIFSFTFLVAAYGFGMKQFLQAALSKRTS